MEPNQYSPAADAAKVDVDEIRALVIPNASSVQRQGRITQVRSLGARHPNVNRHCLHVQAVLGNGRGTTPKEFVAPSSAIPADYVDFCSGAANRRCEIGQQIEQPRVEGALVARAVVAEEVLEAGGCLRNVSVSDTINDIDTFVGVGVI